MKPQVLTSPQGYRKSQSPFQQLINSSINKVKQCYAEQELQQFNQLLNHQQPKKIKQLNIDPYLFVLQYLFGKQQLVYFGLKQLNIIFDQNYYSKSVLPTIIRFLSRSVEKYSSQVVSIVLKVKQPTRQIFELFFEIYSTVLLPEEVARRFRNLGYLWLIRIFQMKQTTIPLYFKFIIDKIGVFELPQLISHQQEKKQLETYVHKIINNVLNKVEDKLQLQQGSQSLVTRKQKKGKYLYCFMCQRSADYYCKDTKVPVCSSQCKKDHLLYISEVNVVNEQFTQEFKQSIEQMLLSNWYHARSPSLSVDYLIAIYIFSTYKPFYDIAHHKIIRSPIMMEKVWLLYGAFYQKRGEMFQHIFVSFLQSENQYLEQLSKYYFLEVSQTHRVLEMYYGYDLKGEMRLFPAIFRKMHEDKEYLSIFITNFVQMIFQNLSAMAVRPSTKNIILTSQLTELFNQSQSPIQTLQKYFPQHPAITTQQQIACFLLKNQCLLKKQRFTRILDKDQSFTRVFLQEITVKRKHSRIDQLLREIFYFINVNVSQKIYRLLQLLYEVYDFQRLGNQQEKRVIEKNDALFQYMYLIIMLNTELHNPNLQKKPTLAEVVERIAVINKPLASQQSHRQVIESMFQRLKTLPFSQHSRGVLHNYQHYQSAPFNLSQFYLPLIILQNHQPIYDTFRVIPMPNSILYRVCTILTFYPDICKLFFRFLLQRLQKIQNQDEYLLQAIRNILQEQPNAVSIEGGWKIIFDYIKETDTKRKKMQRFSITQGQTHKKIQQTVTSPTPSQTSFQGDKKRRRIFQPYNVNQRSSLSQTQRQIIWLQLQNVIVASPLLKHDNFIYFIKDFSGTFSIDTYLNEYEKVIYLNKNRLNSMANSLMNAFRKVGNKWVGLNLVTFIGELEDVQLQVESQQTQALSQSRVNMKDSISRMQKMKNHLIMLMLKQIPVTEITQPLLLQTIITLANSTTFTINPELWQCITHIVLKFKSQQHQSIIEDLMKRYESSQQFYQSLMIQKTLNSQQPELINKDVLVKLDKLQPYLNQLKDKVVKLFILKENLSIIQRNLEKFYHFEETFLLFKENYSTLSNINSVQTFLVFKIQQAIQHQVHLHSLLSQQFLNFLLNSFQKRHDSQSFSSLLIQYFYYLSLCISATSFEEKTTLDKSMIFYQASKQIFLLLKGLEEKVREIPSKKVEWLIEPVLLLSQFCQKFNENIDYRKTISQTYTFKHIIQHYQSNNHSVYLIGLTKQFVHCKQLLWTITLTFNITTKSTEFLLKEMRQLSSSYSDITSNVHDFNKSLSQILDQKTIDDIFIKLRQRVLEFREKLKFLLEVLHEFDGIDNKKVNQQDQSKQTTDFEKVRQQFLMKILFAGVFTVEIRQHNPKTDKKAHMPHQIIRAQPFSEYIDSLGESSENYKQIVQKIIKPSVSSS